MIKAHGTNFPDDTHPHTISLWCYRNYNLTDKETPKWKHMMNVIEALWPEKMPNGGKGHIISKWTVRRVKAWCAYDFQTWWGPSSVGKSADAAVIALVHWLSAPSETSITICSTTGKMLERRIWNDILKYHRMVPGFPGIHYATKFAIILGDENSRNGIFGIAVQKGTVEEAVGNIVGVHNTYNCLIIDEMQATRQAAVEAFDNLSTGKEAKFLGMGNPVSRMDPLGRASKPKHGWDSISTEDEEWETEKGKTLFFDGRKSPGVDDPERFFFMLNTSQIDAMRKDPGEDSPRFWSQRIGFVCPDGVSQSIFSESFAVQHKMQEKPVWSGAQVDIAAVDPAFTTGGDAAIMQHAKVGILRSGLVGIYFSPAINIRLKVSAGTTLEYDLARQIIDLCGKYHVTPQNLGLDCSGTQTAFASILEHEWNSQILRIQCGGAASDFKVEDNDERRGCDIYQNKITELWYSMRKFAIHGQIFGIDDDTIVEFVSRMMDNSKQKICVETKHEMRMRTGASPNKADAATMVLEVARRRFGTIPGSRFTTRDMRESGTSDEELQMYDVDSSDKSYLTDSIF